MVNQVYIRPTPGFSPQIGHLVSMMNYTRSATLQLVKGLTVDALDYIHDDSSNSVGALLLHIAAIEHAQQIWSFEDREFSNAEREHLELPMKLGDGARAQIHGRQIEYYIERLSGVRDVTHRELISRNDEWLYQEVSGKRTNQYCRWFHVIEDEISHRGQMKWLLSRFYQKQQTEL